MTKLVNIVIYTCMNERYDVSRLFAAGIKRFIAAAPEGYAVKVFAMVSDQQSAEICLLNGFEYMVHENFPLGRKWNAGLGVLLEKDRKIREMPKQVRHDESTLDYVMIMGDDDLISNDAWKFYKEKIDGKCDYFGFRSIYFYSPEKEKSIQFMYPLSDPQSVIGCGRMISAKALRTASNKVRLHFNKDFENYCTGDEITLPEYKANYLVQIKAGSIVSPVYTKLWKDEINSCLDASSDKALVFNAAIEPQAMSPIKPLLMDVKTAVNIWSFDKLEKYSFRVSSDEALRFISDEEKYLINTLKIINHEQDSTVRN